MNHSVVCIHYSPTNHLVTDEPEHYCKKILLFCCFKVGRELQTVNKHFYTNSMPFKPHMPRLNRPYKHSLEKTNHNYLLHLKGMDLVQANNTKK